MLCFDPKFNLSAAHNNSINVWLIKQFFWPDTAATE